MDKIIDEEKLAKIVFIYNALESGWTITKRDDNYIFNKKHGEKKEVFEEAYLKYFIKSNSNIQNFLSK
jgi:hypothetical protein